MKCIQEREHLYRQTKVVINVADISILERTGSRTVLGRTECRKCEGKKTTANESITKANAMYSIAGATFGIFSDQNCSNQIGTLTTNENGETNEVEVTAGTVYIKELSAPKGYKLDTTVHSLKVEAGKTAVLNVSDVPKVTETLVDLFKIDMETGKATAQGMQHWQEQSLPGIIMTDFIQRQFTRESNTYLGYKDGS